MISLADVAQASGISKAGLYYHFRSKQELLAAIISYAQDIHEEEVQKVLADSSADDEEDLRRLIHAHAVMMTREDDAAFAVLAVDEMRSLLPADRKHIARRKRDYLSLISERLERLAAAGRLREVDIATATHTLAGMVMWLPKWYRQPGRLSAAQLASEVAELAVHAVLPDGGRKASRRRRPGEPGVKTPTADEARSAPSTTAAPRRSRGSRAKETPRVGGTPMLNSSGRANDDRK
jgi:TetR/AcrR family transcriptional regulator, cholesterol catabolism regulator